MRRTKAESEATAADVLEVAARLFAEHGYAGVGLAQIATEAGVTRGAVYHHFGSKQGLFTAVLAAMHEEVSEAVVAAATSAVDHSPDNPWAGLLAGSRAFLEACSSPRRRRIMLLDGPAVVGWQAWRDLDAAASGRHLNDALRELADQGLLSVPSVPAAGVLLSGAMNEAALWVASVTESETSDARNDAWRTLQRLLEGLQRDSR